jgi:hypothetical protein
MDDKIKLMLGLAIGGLLGALIAWYIVDWYAWREWDQTGLPRSVTSFKHDGVR